LKRAVALLQLVIAGPAFTAVRMARAIMLNMMINVFINYTNHFYCLFCLYWLSLLLWLTTLAS
jgi:hypothetical protein